MLILTSFILFWDALGALTAGAHSTSLFRQALAPVTSEPQLEAAATAADKVARKMLERPKGIAFDLVAIGLVHGALASFLFSKASRHKPQRPDDGE